MKMQAKTDVASDVECGGCSDVRASLSQRDNPEASVPSGAESAAIVAGFSDRLEAERTRRAAASSVSDICSALGIPEWHLYKVVLTEAQQKILATHSAADGPRKEMFGDIIGEALAYAIHCTRADGFRPVWASRSYDSLKYLMIEFVKRLNV